MKNKQTNHPAREERVRILDDAVSGISNRFITEVEEYRAEKTSGGRRASRTHTAPAWLRPVAACLAVLILGGLIVFSIPVVNNILTRRAPAELPGTDPVAEADTKEEETEKKEETEAPVETEEIEVSQFDKKITTTFTYRNTVSDEVFHYIGGNATASFNDVCADAHKIGVGSASDAEKLTVDMSVEEMSAIMGCPPSQFYSRICEWALDDGRIVRATQKYYLLDELYKLAGIWDYEKDQVKENIDEEEGAAIGEKIKEIMGNAPFESVEIFPGPWENTVKHAIKSITTYYLQQDLEPNWKVEVEYVSEVDERTGIITEVK